MKFHIGQLVRMRAGQATIFRADTRAIITHIDGNSLACQFRGVGNTPGTWDDGIDGEWFANAADVEPIPVARTDWLPGDVKPVRPGVYERDSSGVGCWSEWNGSHWGLGSDTPDSAANWDYWNGILQPSDLQCLPWRGLNQPT